MSDITAIILLSIIALIPLLIFAFAAGSAFDEIAQAEKEIEEMNKDGKHKE